MRNERGFTLISVLLAVSMLTIGLLALARTQAILTSSEAVVSNRAIALAIATDRLEQLRGSDPTTLASEPAATVDGTGKPVAGGRLPALGHRHPRRGQPAPADGDRELSPDDLAGPVSRP